MIRAVPEINVLGLGLEDTFYLTPPSIQLIFAVKSVFDNNHPSNFNKSAPPNPLTIDSLK